MRVPLIASALLLAASAALTKAAAQAPDGKALFEDNCRKCHGVRGTPPKTMKEKFPKIVTFDAKFLTEHSVDSIVKVLTKGKNEDMKSFKEKLTAPEMKAVAEYVHEIAKPKP